MALYAVFRIHTAIHGYCLRRNIVALFLILLISTLKMFAQGPPARVVFLLEPTGSNTAALPFADAPEIEIQDSLGNRVWTTATVSIAIATNGGIMEPGTLSGTTTRTAINGRATFTGLSIDKVGAYTLSVSSAGLTSSTTGTFTIIEGAAAAVVFATQPGNGTAGAALLVQPVLQTVDAGGNHVASAGIPVELSVLSGPGGINTVQQNPVQTAAGYATFSGLTFTQAGSYVLRATSAGLQAVESAVFVIEPGAPASVALIHSPSIVQACGTSTQPFVARIYDSFGNRTTGASMTLSLSTSASYTAIAGATGEASNGEVVFSNFTIGAVAGSIYFMRVTGGGLSSTTTASTYVTSGAPQTNNHIAFKNQPTTTINGAVIAGAGGNPVTVRLTDCAGNLATSASYLVYISEFSGTLSFGSQGNCNSFTSKIATTASVNGIASFSQAAVSATANFSYFLFAHTTTASGTTLTSVFSSYAFPVVNGPSTIRVVQYNDRNCNGVQDPGEPGIANWPYSIKTQSGTVVASGLTDAQGVAYTIVTGGTYNVCETTSASWLPTTPLCQTVTASACGTSNVVFGNSSTGTLCITAYNDYNCNGVQDPGEPSLPGWNVSVAGMGGFTTGTNGSVCIPTTAGTYSICQSTRAGWSATTPLCTATAVSPCATSYAAFGNASTGTLCITKFNDINLNTVQDPGEPGLPGWTFTVSNGSASLTATTGTNGTVCAEVGAGSWTVCETPQAGWTPTGTTNTCKTIEVASCQIAAADFGNTNSALLCVHKFEDFNCNGVQDQGEPNLAGWQFTLLGPNGEQQQLITNPLCDACTPVAPGQWIVCEIVPPNESWTPTTPGGICQLVDALLGSQHTAVFGNARTGTIGVHKFEDFNCNGVQDQGEPNLAGWTFTLSGPGNATHQLVTDMNGNAQMPVVPGQWLVCEVLPDGWTPTSAVCKSVTVATCQQTTAVFANARTGSLCVHQYEDFNCNGVQDQGEPNIAARQVLFHSQGDTVAVWTNAHGDACATLAPGTWTVTLALPQGWVQTTPSTQSEHIVSVCQQTSVAVGSAHKGVLCVRKFEDANCNGVQDQNEPNLGGWTFTLSGPHGEQQQVITNALCDACIPVTPGVWSVCEVVPPQQGWSATTQQGLCQTVSVSTCSRSTLVFGNAQLGTLTVQKYNDLNCNGVRDAGEPGLSNWVFRAIRSNGSVVMLLTDASGTTTASLRAGNWIVCEQPQPGWQPSPPLTLCKSVSVPVCQSTSAVFGNASTGTLCITKFHDVNTSGAHDAGEPLLANWSFTLSNGSESRVVTTDSSGMVCALLPPGQWAVCEQQQAGWYSTTGECTSASVSICNTTVLSVGNAMAGQIPARGNSSGFPGSSEEQTAENNSAAHWPMTATIPQSESAALQLQVVPNPTSGAAVISYVLLQPAVVQVELYSTLGQRIATLAAEHQHAGQHAIPVDMQEFPTGYYQVRLTANGHTSTTIVVNHK